MKNDKAGNDEEQCCIKCKHYYFYPPQHDQPYPEFACLKEHWDGISCNEEYDELFNKIDCVDFLAQN